MTVGLVLQPRGVSVPSAYVRLFVGWLSRPHGMDARGHCAVAESELPMQPITVMRNALGEDQGGSGVAMDPEAYKESVAYWSTHAPIQ